MRLALFFFFFLCLWSFGVQAQSLSPGVFAASGSASQQLSYTIGEPLTFTFSSSSNRLTQGFHQTNLEVVSVEESNEQFQFSVYPNPTRNELRFSFPSNFDTIAIQIYDAQGKLIHRQQIYHQESVQMATFARGLYTVVIHHSHLSSPKHFSVIRS